MSRRQSWDNLIRFKRSTAFRLALLHTALFIASVAVIGVVAGFAITRALETQARDRIEAEAVALKGQFKQHGASALGLLIDARSSILERRLRIALIAADGTTVAGDAELATYAAAVPGTIGRRTRHDDEDGGDTMLVGAWPFGRLTLVIADDLASAEDVQHVLWTAFGTARTVP